MKSAVSFEKINNKKVFQILTEPNISSKKIVIMNHGFRGTSIGPSRSFVDFESLLIEKNFAVLRFDQPCSGNSEGIYLNSSFNEWIKTTAYFAKKYLNLGYDVVLLGQSMGATTTMVVAGQENLRNRIPCIILWVPDAKSNVNVEPNKVYEEGGQKYRGKFWIEAKEADFFGALDNYPGGIHLVYGEKDKYVPQRLRTQTIDKVKSKNQPYMILPRQDHSSWEYDMVQKVYMEEIKFLRKYF